MSNSDGNDNKDRTEAGVEVNTWKGWQQVSQKQRIWTAFTTGFRPDIILSLGEGTEVRCHKFLLQISSPLLDRMIDNLGSGGFVCGSSGLPILRIPDVDPKIFKLMLEYFYNEDIDYNLAEGDEPEDIDDNLADEDEPSLTDMLRLVGLAMKYEVPVLADGCVALLNEQVVVDNVLELFQGGMEYGHKELISITLAYINEHASVILSENSFVDDSFVDLRLECLIEIIKQDDLAVQNEMEVFDAVYRWGERQLKNASSTSTGENTTMRSILQKPLAYIRFPLMNKGQFALKVATRSLLNSEETISLLITFLLPVDERSALPEGRFISTRRKNMGISELDTWEKTLAEHNAVVQDLETRIQQLEIEGQSKDEQARVTEGLVKDGRTRIQQLEAEQWIKDDKVAKLQTKVTELENDAVKMKRTYEKPLPTLFNPPLRWS